MEATIAAHSVGSDTGNHGAVHCLGFSGSPYLGWSTAGSGISILPRPSGVWGLSVLTIFWNIQNLHSHDNICLTWDFTWLEWVVVIESWDSWREHCKITTSTRSSQYVAQRARCCFCRSLSVECACIILVISRKIIGVLGAEGSFLKLVP